MKIVIKDEFNCEIIINMDHVSKVLISDQSSNDKYIAIYGKNFKALYTATDRYTENYDEILNKVREWGRE